MTYNVSTLLTLHKGVACSATPPESLALSGNVSEWSEIDGQDVICD